MSRDRKPVLRSLVDRIYDTKAFYYSLKRARREDAAGRLPLGGWLRLCRRGFFPDKHALFDFDRHRHRDYLSDMQIIRSSHVDGEYGVVLSDKVLFELTMQRFVRVPKNFALVRRGDLIWLAGEDRTEHGLLSLLQEQGRLIVKPRRSNCGKGVQLASHERGSYRLAGRELDGRSLQDALLSCDDAIICEYIRQGSWTRALYPHSVNTVRLVTMIDPAEQTPFVAMAFLRIGCDRSAPVDNGHAGGLCCDVDLETGRLGEASRAYCGDSLLGYRRHPETGAPIEGQTIPGWIAICDQMLDLAGRFPMLPYVAWDVALLDDGIAVIEGNRWTDYVVSQRERPLLASRRVREFFRAHGIV